MRSNDPNLQYIAVSVSVIRQITGAMPFDVFIKRTEDAFTRMFPKGEVVDESRITEYQQNKGIETLYVSELDFSKYQVYVDEVFAKLRMDSDPISDADIAQLVNHAIDVVTIELCANLRVDEKTISQSSLVVKSCVDVLNSKPGVLARLIKFVNSHPYSMKHSVMTSLFAVILAKADGMSASKNLENIGLGGLLHDLGMSRITFDEESKKDLTAEEWKELKQHPEQGKKLLDAVGSVQSEVKIIVLQHHEQINGGGYPNSLLGQAIFRPVKIVTIADVFTSLITKRTYREEFKPTVAISIMIEDRGKFDEGLVVKLADVLGLKVAAK